MWIYHPKEDEGNKTAYLIVVRLVLTMSRSFSDSVEERQEIEGHTVKAGLIVNFDTSPVGSGRTVTRDLVRMRKNIRINKSKPRIPVSKG